MTASALFSAASFTAMAGWLILGVSVIWKQDFLRDQIAGRWIPVGLAAVYTVLILFFFGSSEGGFDTLAHVQQLFTNPWAALAGWIHYLAFDLLVGARIARRVMTQGTPRWTLIFLLPATFLFGPIGLLGAEITTRAFAISEVPA